MEPQHVSLPCPAEARSLRLHSKSVLGMGGAGRIVSPEQLWKEFLMVPWHAPQGWSVDSRVLHASAY